MSRFSCSTLTESISRRIGTVLIAKDAKKVQVLGQLLMTTTFLLAKLIRQILYKILWYT